MDLMITRQINQHYDILVKPTQVITRQSTDIASANDKYIAKALTFIHKNIDNRINVSDVLKEVPLSRRALTEVAGNRQNYFGDIT